MEIMKWSQRRHITFMSHAAEKWINMHTDYMLFKMSNLALCKFYMYTLRKSWSTLRDIFQEAFKVNPT